MINEEALAAICTITVGLCRAPSFVHCISSILLYTAEDGKGFSKNLCGNYLAVKSIAAGVILPDILECVIHYMPELERSFR